MAGEHFTRQSVRWRETHDGGKAKLANDSRVVYPPYLATRHRHVRYPYPSNKDPLVYDGEYELIEESLKKGLGD